MTKSPDYSLGYHERWEAWLHWWRHQAASSGAPPDNQAETKALEEWLTRNRKHAAEPVSCSVCQEQIAQAMLLGEDPFKVPTFAKEAIENFGAKFERKYLKKQAGNRPKFLAL